MLGTIAAKLAGVPHVVRTVHGLREPMTGWERLKFRIYEALDRMTLLCFADFVIAVSMRMADTLRASGYRPTSVTHIHNGVDLEAIAPTRTADAVRRELGIHRRALVVGAAGRLSPVKGHASLLRAAHLILERRPDAKVLIVGGGPLHADLLDQASRLGIADACVFSGPRHDAPRKLIAAMDVFVLPSLRRGHSDGAPRGDGARQAGGRHRGRRRARGHPGSRQRHPRSRLTTSGHSRTPVYMR